MNLVVPVIFTETKDKKDTVLAFIPDIEGVTEGYGIDDAIEMARDYIGNIVVDMKETPTITKITEIRSDVSPFCKEGVTYVSLVDVNIEKFRKDTKMIRRNITIPNWLNEMANKKGVNVSAVTQKALISLIEAKKNKENI